VRLARAKFEGQPSRVPAESQANSRPPHLTTRRVGVARILLGIATLIACVATIGTRIGSALAEGLTGPSYVTPTDRSMS